MNGFLAHIEHKTSAQHFNMHTHPDCQLIYVKSGCLRLTVTDKEYVAEAPSFLFLNNMVPHAIVTEGEYNERYVFYIDFAEAQREIRNRTLLSVFTIRQQPKYIMNIVSQRQEIESLIDIMMSLQRDQLPMHIESVNAAFGLLLSMLYGLHPEHFNLFETKIQNVVFDIKQELESCHESDLKVQDFATKYHFNEYYLSHAFAEITGYSIKQYQMLCRLAAASAMLEDTDKNITEICYTAGFSDASNFARYFKQEMGKTPSEYRRQARLHAKTKNSPTAGLID